MILIVRAASRHKLLERLAELDVLDSTPQDLSDQISTEILTAPDDYLPQQYNFYQHSAAQLRCYINDVLNLTAQSHPTASY
jgi:hypothetical protein